MAEKLERATYSLNEARQLLGISKDTAYKAAHAGNDIIDGVPIYQIWGRFVVPKALLDARLGINQTRKRRRSVQRATAQEGN